jgi:hypothetical protein
MNTQDYCPPVSTLKSRQFGFGPNVKFAHITLPAVPAIAYADYGLLLPKPSSLIMLVSCSAGAIPDSLFLHFYPLNKSYAAGAIVPTGNEEWFPFTNGVTGYVKLGTFFKFKQTLSGTVYFDIGYESGANPHNMTFACGDEDDIDYVGNLFQSTP